MEAFFSRPIFDVNAIMQQEVARVLAAFGPLEQWVPGDVLLQRLDPARNNGIRAQLTAIERACRTGQIEAAERRAAPRSPYRVVCYRRLLV